jgi:peptidoglycan hydrolase CwlO-like protein
MDEEAKKKKILWISVGVIGTTIFMFWIYTFSFNARNILNTKQSNSTINISEIKEDFSKLNDELTKIQKNVDKVIKESPPLENDPTTIKEEIKESLKKQLEQATSTNIIN